MIYDASNALVAQATAAGNSNAVFSRFLPDGTLAYSIPEFSEALPNGGIAIDSLGNAVFSRPVVNDIGASGLYFEVVGPTGGFLFNHDKGTQFRIDIVNDGVTVNSIASDAHRHFAFRGFYNQGLPWIQIYETVP